MQKQQLEQRIRAAHAPGLVIHEMERSFPPVDAVRLPPEGKPAPLPERQPGLQRLLQADDGGFRLLVQILSQPVRYGQLKHDAAFRRQSVLASQIGKGLHQQGGQISLPEILRAHGLADVRTVKLLEHTMDDLADQGVIVPLIDFLRLAQPAEVMPDETLGTAEVGIQRRGRDSPVQKPPHDLPQGRGVDSPVCK